MNLGICGLSPGRFWKHLGREAQGESYSDAQVYDDDREEDNSYYGGKHKVYRLNSFWGKLAIILVAVGIIFLIFSIVSEVLLVCLLR